MTDKLPFTVTVFPGLIVSTEGLVTMLVKVLVALVTTTSVSGLVKVT